MKRVVVTGAASGIGLAITRALVEDDFQVAMIDIDEEALHDCSSGLANVTTHVMDVSNEDTWNAIGQQWPDRIDAIVHNALALTVKPMHEQTPDEYRRQISVLLDPIYLSMRGLHEQLRTARGCMVLISSVHARVGLPGHPVYAAVKAGMGALARQMAVDYGPEVRVNAVLPGPILTPVWEGVSDEVLDEVARQTTVGRMGTPEDVASVVAFLVSPRAEFIDGAEIMVDGGWSITRHSR